jgi:hypothetical protein
MKNIKQAEPLPDYWRHHIQAWQQTDKAQISYCRAHDLSYHRFTYWRRKLLVPGTTSRQVVPHSSFAPVKAVSPGVCSHLTATLPGKKRFETDSKCWIFGRVPGSLKSSLSGGFFCFFVTAHFNK